jgi:hypothetical protein
MMMIMIILILLLIIIIIIIIIITHLNDIFLHLVNKGCYHFHTNVNWTASSDVQNSATRLASRCPRNLGKDSAQWCDQNYVSAIFKANSQTDQTFSSDN